MRVVVVGSGVLGASLAFHLQEGGADVTLVDALGPGSGTSSRGAGIVSEAMWHPTSLHLVQRSAEILSALSRQGEDGAHPFRFTVTGSTTLLSAAQAGAGRDLAMYQARAGAEVQVLAPRGVPALPRHAGMDLRGVDLALHYPRDGWAMPRLFAEVAAHQAKQRGATVRRGSVSLAIRDGAPSVHVDGEELRADAVALAAGVHTRSLLQQAGLDAPLLAYRTQAARIHHPRAGDVPILHDGVQGSYLRPGWKGQLVAGNGTTTTPEDITSWRAEADDEFVERSLTRIGTRFPFLADAHADAAWAGIDAATPDRLLLAGRHPNAAGLWILAGGNGHGFMRAPATGESLAALMLAKRPRVDLSSYDPARFSRSDPFEIREGYSVEGHAFK